MVNASVATKINSKAMAEAEVRWGCLCVGFVVVGEICFVLLFVAISVVVGEICFEDLFAALVVAFDADDCEAAIEALLLSLCGNE